MYEKSDLNWFWFLCFLPDVKQMIELQILRHDNVSTDKVTMEQAWSCGEMEMMRSVCDQEWRV